MYIVFNFSVVCLLKINLKFKAKYSGWIFLKPVEFQPVSKRSQWMGQINSIIIKWKQSAWEVKEICSWESNWGQKGIQYIEGELGDIFRAWGAVQCLHSIFHAFLWLFLRFIVDWCRRWNNKDALLCEFSLN